MLFKEIVDGRTHGRTDDGRRTLKDHKSSLSTSCSGELIKNFNLVFKIREETNCEKRCGGSSVNGICFNEIKFLKLLPSCKLCIHYKGLTLR